MKNLRWLFVTITPVALVFARAVFADGPHIEQVGQSTCANYLADPNQVAAQTLADHSTYIAVALSDQMAEALLNYVKTRARPENLDEALSLHSAYTRRLIRIGWTLHGLGLIPQPPSLLNPKVVKLLNRLDGLLESHNTLMIEDSLVHNSYNYTVEELESTSKGLKHLKDSLPMEMKDAEFTALNPYTWIFMRTILGNLERWSENPEVSALEVKVHALVLIQTLRIEIDFLKQALQDPSQKISASRAHTIKTFLWELEYKLESGPIDLLTMNLEEIVLSEFIEYDHFDRRSEQDEKVMSMLILNDVYDKLRGLEPLLGEGLRSSAN